MASRGVSSATDRVAERRRAVALARHFREAEGLSIAQIADRLGRSPATVKAYFYDPTGEKARAFKARRVHRAAQRQGRRVRVLQGVPPRGRSSGTGPPERVLAAMIEWRSRYGRLPTAYDWSRTHVRRRGGEAVARLAEGEWPAASVVTRVFGTWSAARAAAAEQAGEMTREPASASSSFGRESISLPKPRESAAISEVLSGGERKPEPIDLQVLVTAATDFAHNSGR